MVRDVDNKVQPNKLVVLIPSTFTSNLKNRLIRTYVIGELARILGIGRVTHVFVYHDKDPYFDSNALGRYITKVLKYAVTPPWLKKKVFPLSQDNKYLGVIPPLQISSHISDDGPIIWGYTSNVSDNNVVVRYRHNRKWFNKQISKEQLLANNYSLKTNQLVLLDLERDTLVSTMDLSRDRYVGFHVSYLNLDLHKSVKRIRDLFPGPIVGTSRRGKYLEDANLTPTSKENITLVFGGPNRGLYDIVGFRLRDFDYMINIMSHQETKTLRTEEAVMLTLSKLNLC